MANPSSSLTDQYRRLILDDEEEDDLVDLVAPQQNLQESLIEYGIVGRFNTKRTINVMSMKNMMAEIWAPVKGVWIQELSTNLFLFQFFHELDLERVLKQGPWTFDKHVLLFEQVVAGMDPKNVVLNNVYMWVQVTDLPAGLMSETVATQIGNYIGTYVEADANNFNGVWRSYMRILVAIPVDKAIKRRMKVRKQGQEIVWLNFMYERLPSFCFFCGIIGHSERFCEKLFDFPDKSVERLFGTWLRAPVRRNAYSGGSAWLRNGPPENSPAMTVEMTDQLAKNSGSLVPHVSKQMASNFTGLKIREENIPRQPLSKKGETSLSSRANIGGKENACTDFTAHEKNYNPTVNMGLDSGLDVIEINDPKRRRTNEEEKEYYSNSEEMETDLSDHLRQDLDGSVEASTGDFQARPAL